MVIIGIGITVLILLGLASVLIRSKRELIRQKIIEFKKDFFFSGMIKSLNFSYLPICISISASIQSMDVSESDQVVVNTIINTIFLLLLLVTPFLIAHRSLKSSEEFKTAQME